MERGSGWTESRRLSVGELEAEDAGRRTSPERSKVEVSADSVAGGGKSGPTSVVHDGADHPVKALLHLLPLVLRSAVQRDDTCAIDVTDCRRLVGICRVETGVGLSLAGKNDERDIGASSPESLE